MEDLIKVFKSIDITGVILSYFYENNPSLYMLDENLWGYNNSCEVCGFKYPLKIYCHCFNFKYSINDLNKYRLLHKRRKMLISMFYDSDYERPAFCSIECVQHMIKKTKINDIFTEMKLLQCAESMNRENIKNDESMYRYNCYEIRICEMRCFNYQLFKLILLEKDENDFRNNIKELEIDKMFDIISLF
jgi:hypothetical protein